MVKAQPKFKRLPLAARWTIILFCAGGFLSVLHAIACQTPFAPGKTLLFLTLAAATARAKINLYRGATISFLTAVVLLAVITDGPAVAVSVGLGGVSVQSLFPWRKAVLHQMAFNAGMIALTVTATWWTHHWFAGTPAVASISAEMSATLLASFVYFLGNSLSVSLIVSLTKRISPFRIWSQHFLYSAPSFLIAGLLSVAIYGLANSPFLFVGIVLLVSLCIAYYCSIRLTAEAVS